MERFAEACKDIATIYIGITYPRVQEKTSCDSLFNYKLLTLKSFNENNIINENFVEDFKTNKKIDEKYFAKEGDLLIKLNSPINLIYIKKEYENLLVPIHFAIIRCNSNKISNKFLYTFLKNFHFQKLLLGGTIAFLHISTLNNIDVPNFSIEKQEKIAKIYELMEKQNIFYKNLITKIELKNKIIINQLLKEKND